MLSSADSGEMPVSICEQSYNYVYFIICVYSFIAGIMLRMCARALVFMTECDAQYQKLILQVMHKALNEYKARQTHTGQILLRTEVEWKLNRIVFTFNVPDYLIICDHLH